MCTCTGHSVDTPLATRIAYILIAGERTVKKMCSTSSKFDFIGCKTETTNGISAEVCVCNTPLCNKAAMTSSLGHVIIMVAIVASVITARLM